MKVIIAGTRTLTDLSSEYLDSVTEKSDFIITEIVCGCAEGVDTAGEAWGDENLIPVKHFQADWALYGNYAGPIRNKKMAVYADALILIWNGSSKGSQSMKNEMRKLNKPIYEVIIKV